jgi:drug/metabolite transporter (DMT)-like permease
VIRDREGVLLCLLSAGAYSTAAIFAKFAYRADLGVATLLATRYVLASLALWAVVARTRTPLPARAVLARGLALGLAGYSLQALLFFSALARMDAAPASLLLYSFPAMVTVAAVALGRERPSRRRAAALAVATAGVALVLVGGGGTSVDGLGALMALGAAATYTVYILVGDALLRRASPLVLAALVCTGAATTFVAGGLALGRADLDFAPRAWLPIAAIALVSTVLAVVTGFAGVRRVGPTVNSILMTVEVPLTAAMAVLLLGEGLHPGQVAGGALIPSAVLLLQFRPSPAALPQSQPSVPGSRPQASLE